MPSPCSWDPADPCLIEGNSDPKGFCTLQSLFDRGRIWIQRDSADSSPCLTEGEFRSKGFCRFPAQQGEHGQNFPDPQDVCLGKFILVLPGGTPQQCGDPIKKPPIFPSRELRHRQSHWIFCGCLSIVRNIRHQSQVRDAK